MDCPCCSGLHYKDCCKSIIENDNAPSAEALMRSRYSAYATGQLNYVYETYSSEAKKALDKADFINSTDDSNWCGLVIVFTDSNIVEFKAFSKFNNRLYILHERSEFIQEAGKWRYHDGEIRESGPAKIARNEPCFCGSGKKFKRCCQTRLFI